MGNKNPLDEICKGIVAFRMGEGGAWASNSPLWSDSTIREYWIAMHEGTVLEEEEEEEMPDYETWNNDDLRAELSKRKLSVDGKKADLVARLEENDTTLEG